MLLLANHFGVSVCPHAGGVGLCEYVRHIALVDYIVVSATTDGRVCESTTHLHEHFYDTERFLERGRYVAPAAPGYATMRKASREAFTYPNGSKWVARLANKAAKQPPATPRASASIAAAGAAGAAAGGAAGGPYSRPSSGRRHYKQAGSADLLSHEHPGWFLS